MNLFSNRVDAFRVTVIKEELRKTNGVVMRAADNLQMPRSGLRRWIQILGIPKGYGRMVTVVPLPEEHHSINMVIGG